MQRLVAAGESASPQPVVMQGIAACVVICRFEAAEVGATDDDDTVLYKILMVRVLLADTDWSNQERLALPY